jgi:hypothetical protein
MQPIHGAVQGTAIRHSPEMKGVPCLDFQEPS